MNEEMFNQLRGASIDKLSAGEFLSNLIITQMQNMALSLIEAATLDAIIEKNDGSYEPKESSLYRSILEVLALVTDENVTQLFVLLRKLPIAKKEKHHYIFYINGEEVSRGDWMSADQIKGKRTLGHSSGTVPGENREVKYNDLTLEEFKKSAIAGTRAGEMILQQVFGVNPRQSRHREFAPSEYIKPETEHKNSKELGEPDEDDIDYDEFGDIIPKGGK